MKESPQKINDNSSKASVHKPGNGKGIFIPVSFQPKLTIGAVNDPLEHEADAIADKVMRMPEPSVQQQTFPAPYTSFIQAKASWGKEELQRKEDKEGAMLEPLPEITSRLALDTPIAPPVNNINNIQRKCAACEHEEKEQNIHRKENQSQTPEVSESFASYVSSLDNSGSPLPADTRSFFEPRFGYDFSNVRVHTDSIAAKSADSINALAYTSSSNIVFNQNQFSPGTDSGKRLLGHELTHVVQQGSPNIPAIQKQDDDFDSILQLASGNLAFGQVVFIEVRGSGRVEDMTHEYPIDVNGFVKLPMLGLVTANGLTTDQLASNIQTRLISGGFLTSPTVNVTLTSKIVAYGALITSSPLFMRLLGAAGSIEPESGSYPLRIDGTLNLPYVGSVNARNRRLDDVEAEIQRGYRNQYINNAVVHLTTQSLT